MISRFNPVGGKTAICPTRLSGALFNGLGWLGAGLMIIFSFTLLPAFGILGLTLLTCQAVHSKQHNLTVLNSFSILGLLLNIMGLL